MDYGIFNVHTDVNACDCTRGLQRGCWDAVRESGVKVNSRRKIPCRAGESNLRRRRAGPMLYQLSYIFTHTHTDVRSYKCEVAPTYLGRLFLSRLCTTNLAASVSESSVKGNDFAVWSRNGGRKSGVSRLCVMIG